MQTTTKKKREEKEVEKSRAGNPYHMHRFKAILIGNRKTKLNGRNKNKGCLCGWRHIIVKRNGDLSSEPQGNGLAK